MVISAYFIKKFWNCGHNAALSRAYSFTYLLYAIMMSAGLVLHCILLDECQNNGDHSKCYEVVGKIVASLTSCIAVSFGFIGLLELDCKWLPGPSYFMVIMASVYLFIFYDYFKCRGQYLYFGSILVGCPVYMIIQLYQLVKDWNLVKALFLVLAGIAGGTSVYLIRCKSCWLCENLGPWSEQGVWYYGSDASIFFLGLYIMNSLA